MFFNSQPEPELPHVEHSRIQTSLVFIQQLHGLLRTGSTAVVPTCVYRQRVLLPVKTRPGLDGPLGGTSATSYTPFSAKGKAKSARSAVLRLYCICFHTGDAERTGKPNQHSWKALFIVGPLHRSSSSLSPMHPPVP